MGKSLLRDPGRTGNLARIGYLHVMSVRAKFLNRIVAALVPLFLTCAIAMAEDTAKLDELFTRLKAAGAEEAGRIEKEIWIEWSKSGSPALDLLLLRGRDAMELGDNAQAIEHFTAIIDHDPSFAEGWNARATAYFTAGEFGPSLADIGQVLTLNPRHFGALTGLAMILEESGRPEKALEAYKAALAIHPHLEGVEEAVKRLETQETGQEL
jgi:tetratricopeptide (TPR) repeat protein